MEIEYFRVIRKSIMDELDRIDLTKDTVLVHGRYKRPHENVEESGFRGSRFRGVSKNKGKWQVSGYQTYSFR